MTTVLVLDTATKTGWCVTVDGMVVAYGLLRLDEGVTAKGDFNRQPAILRNAYADILDLIELHLPDFVVAEIPHLRGSSSFLTVAIYGVVELLAAHSSVGFYGVHTASWQSRIVPAPKGTPKVKGDTKKRSIAHVISLGFDPESDDVADAICIAQYVHRELKIGGETFGFETAMRPAA